MADVIVTHDIAGFILIRKDALAAVTVWDDVLGETCTVFMAWGKSNAAEVVFLHIWDALSPTVGVDEDYRFEIRASGTESGVSVFPMDLDNGGISFSYGLSFSCSTDEDGSGAPSDVDVAFLVSVN